MKTDQLYIDDRRDYFCGNLVDILKFKACNLKLDKKHEKTLIFISLVMLAMIKNIVTVGQLYLSINKVFGYISEKYDVKYLTIHKGDAMSEKYNQVFSALRNKIESEEGKEITFNDEFDKIKFSSKSDFPLDKLIYFSTITVIFRCVFKKDEIYYPQVYLDDARCQI